MLCIWTWSCLPLCDPLDCHKRPVPGFYVHGIFQARMVVVYSLSRVQTLLWLNGLKPARLLCPWNSPGKNTEEVTISYSRKSSQPVDQTSISCFSCICRWILSHWATWEAHILYITQTKKVIGYTQMLRQVLLLL